MMRTKNNEDLNPYGYFKLTLVCINPAFYLKVFDSLIITIEFVIEFRTVDFR